MHLLRVFPLLLSCSTVMAGQAAVAAPGAENAESAGKPLWEVGAGVGVLSLPAWRGSDDTRSYVLPVPYFIYHGKYLRADRHGVRGVLFDSDRVDLGISLAAAPPVGSDRSRARAGMADLDATAEIGPQLDLTLWRSDDRERQLKLLLPLRSAFTLSSPPRQAGWVFSPALNLDVGDLAALPGWRLGLRSGPIFATRRQHAYYYQVSPAEATATRPAYEAGGGYSGSQFLASLSRRYPGYWVGGYVRYDALQGAAFEDSPLVARSHYLAMGVAVAWILGESAERVSVDD
ncbi:MipA/OmpV family protein [Zoogloea dura]|nr:MipA/OmpV family protein [Zoogloea dura]